MSSIINAIVSTFPGLPSLSVPVSSSIQASDLYNEILTRLPETVASTPLFLTTSSGKPIDPASSSYISDLSENADFLSLRLVPLLLGGKGGFGSQLRAAGGRMSSRKKRKGEENNDSCRNLDGRRIRTVKEAKALAAYLEIKPEMDRKEKERRKERYRKIIEQAESIDEFGASTNVRFDDVKWLEQTEEEREKTREAVLKAMDGLQKKDNSGSSGNSEDDDDEKDASPGATTPPMASEKKPLPVEKVFQQNTVTTSGPRFAGFDDDEFMSSSDEEDDDEGAEPVGMGKAIA